MSVAGQEMEEYFCEVLLGSGKYSPFEFRINHPLISNLHALFVKNIPLGQEIYSQELEWVKG